MSKDSLRKELRSAGASDIEAADLARLAHHIRHTHNVLRPSLPPKKTSIFMRRPYLSWGSLASLALLIVLTISAQYVLPGNWLYPVQRTSDTLAASLDSTYRARVMMKRADQVKQLVNAHASTPTVLSTLADYQHIASAYASTASNYAAFDHCKNVLEQAAVTAKPTERQAIDATLESLRDV